MLIVVEENQAQTYSANREKVMDALGDVIGDIGLDDLNLNLPGWLKSIIKKSGKVADRLLKELRKAIGSALREIVKDIVKGTLVPGGGIPVSRCQKAIFDGLALATTGPKPGKAFLDQYGEEVVARCLRDIASLCYSRVVVLTDQQATFPNFKSTLEQLHQDGYTIDILLDVHGCSDESAMNNNPCNDGKTLTFTDDKITPGQIEGINSGQPMNLNAVYMVSCWGANFNPSWQKLGAKAVNGSKELNYYVLLSPLVFMTLFAAGLSLKEAAQRAYDAERMLVNGRAFKFKLKVSAKVAGISVKKTATIRVGVTWEKLINRILAKQYGEKKNKPVDNVRSSKRVHTGSNGVRRASL
jgi:hypothetical protein